jgi:hypothetical protein
MLTLTEWLVKVGFQGQNPFARKQADEEGEQLQEYFIEHRSYNEILDAGQPRSSILHAPRGAGKSTTRRMFERSCQAYAPHLRPLLVQLIDWMPIVEQAGSVAAVGPRHYLDEILRQAVLALGEEAAPPPAPPLVLDLAGYLNWICLTYSTYLTYRQRQALAERGWAPERDPGRLAEYAVDTLPVERALRLLAEILGELGYGACYVLIDGVDELFQTTANWEAGADLLAPLLGNLRLLEIPRLVFKCFVPSEIVAVLRQREILRQDRIACYGLEWDRYLLKTLLQARLEVFSDGLVSSLASLAPEIRDIDDRLCAAAGSPRELLNLGDRLFQTCAQEADDNHLFIQPRQLERLLATGDAPPAPALTAPHATPPAVPPLRICDDGRIWRGDELIDRSEKLPKLQRRLLDYLYTRRGQLCENQKIIDYVWDGELPSGDDGLRKLVKRVIEFIEPDPKDPVYIKNLRGFYRLDNAS